MLNRDFRVIYVNGNRKRIFLIGQENLAKVVKKTPLHDFLGIDLIVNLENEINARNGVNVFHKRTRNAFYMR